MGAVDEGFQLNPGEIADHIHADVVKPGWHLRTYLDGYAHPDFRTGMIWEVDPVDRAVLVFVGSHEEARAVEKAVKRALAEDA